MSGMCPQLNKTAVLGARPPAQTRPPTTVRLSVSGARHPNHAALIMVQRKTERQINCQHAIRGAGTRLSGVPTEGGIEGRTEVPQDPSTVRRRYARRSKPDRGGVDWTSGSRTIHDGRIDRFGADDFITEARQRWNLDALIAQPSSTR